MAETKRIEFEKLSIGQAFRHSNLPYRKITETLAEPGYPTQKNSYFDGPEFVTIIGR